VTGAGRPAQLPHGSDDRLARPLPVVLLDDNFRSTSTTSAPSPATFWSMRLLLSLTARSERRSGMPEEGMTRQCAAAHSVGASRNRRMRMDRPRYSIHNRHSMDHSIILSLSSTRRTVRCAAMPTPQPLDQSPRRISAPGVSDEEPSAAGPMRRPMLDAAPYRLLDEVTALLRARRLADARRRPPRGAAELS
jgi:hypothetical protein